MFIDSAKIHIKAGDGGNGAVAFHREKYVNAGGPDGGDGGKGGDVVFLVDQGSHTLADFRYRHKYIAKNGANGSGNNKSGKSGEDLVIKVPAGTLVKNAGTGEILADLTKTGQREILCKGGNGGRGNQHFASATRQIPMFAKIGGLGEDLDVVLELKLLADVGLVGFPNVGKSTFLSMVSAAKPEIANYHFTTVKPNLGVVSMDIGQSFVLADIPGLIEGAAQGAGLGHDFLRHIERTKLVLHVVDVSGSEGRDPIQDFEAINKELAEYNSVIASRPQIVAANKMDISDSYYETFRQYVEEKGWEVFPVSAATNTGIKPLLGRVYQILQELPDTVINDKKEERVIYKAVEEAPFKVEVVNGVYEVTGNWVRGLVGSTNFDSYDSLQHFQRMIRQRGVVDALEKAGINEKDTVRMYEIEFDYIR